MNMSLDEKVNGDLNKVRVDVQLDEPTTGHMQIVEIVDLNNQVFTAYFPSYKFCKKYSFPFKFNFKDLQNQFNDPKSTLVEYDGEETLPWTGS
jgi:dTDP-4-dehydrorhamnose 3,5-epimerase-like enzyme